MTRLLDRQAADLQIDIPLLAIVNIKAVHILMMYSACLVLRFATSASDFPC